MRLDYDLIRDLLLTLEDICDRDRNYIIPQVHENYLRQLRLFYNKISHRLFI
jgi:hypothetical protein